VPTFLKLALLAATSAAYAQDYRAKVQGLITDSTNASVAGAKVTLRNQGTGIEAARLSGPAGNYIFDFVEPGAYTVSAELAGFSRTTRQNVTVQTRADVTVNLSLNPGQVADSITVTDAAPQLQFNSSTRELTVDRKMLSELPVKQRNPFSLALLDPAVVNRYGAERNPFFMWSSSSIDVGGSTNRKNDLLLDGAPLQLNQKGSYAPPMDAVQEFSVQQNSVDAEFGHSAGGVLSLSIKSGTNNINPHFRFEPRVRISRMLVRINIHRGLKAAKTPAEDSTQWVTNQTSPFSSRSTAFSRSTSRDRALLPMVV